MAELLGGAAPRCRAALSTLSTPNGDSTPHRPHIPLYNQCVYTESRHRNKAQHFDTQHTNFKRVRRTHNHLEVLRHKSACKHKLFIIITVLYTLHSNPRAFCHSSNCSSFRTACILSLSHQLPLPLNPKLVTTSTTPPPRSPAPAFEVAFDNKDGRRCRHLQPPTKLLRTPATAVHTSQRRLLLQHTKWWFLLLRPSSQGPNTQIPHNTVLTRPLFSHNPLHFAKFIHTSHTDFHPTHSLTTYHTFFTQCHTIQRQLTSPWHPQSCLQITPPPYCSQIGTFHTNSLCFWSSLGPGPPHSPLPQKITLSYTLRPPNTPNPHIPVHTRLLPDPPDIHTSYHLRLLLKNNSTWLHLLQSSSPGPNTQIPHSTILTHTLPSHNPLQFAHSIHKTHPDSQQAHNPTLYHALSTPYHTIQRKLTSTRHHHNYLQPQQHHYCAQLGNFPTKSICFWCSLGPGPPHFPLNQKITLSYTPSPPNLSNPHVPALTRPPPPSNPLSPNDCFSPHPTSPHIQSVYQPLTHQPLP